ncbi:MAG: hypothetical protein DMG70_12750 [Acidobacteria bacterium]|nr:MAG: hypothetical protein DMG70_12750 [Acidobacteriota bacterium]
MQSSAFWEFDEFEVRGKEAVFLAGNGAQDEVLRRCLRGSTIARRGLAVSLPGLGLADVAFLSCGPLP